MKVVRVSRAVATAWTAAALLAGGAAIGTWFRVPQPAYAVSSLVEESFAVCTAYIDDGIEGFFILDFETGDLSGGVLGQTPLKFTRNYRHNVLKDLDVKAGKVKNPRFTLLPGAAAVGGPVGTNMAQSVLYVTDVSTGVTVAYGIPWNSQMAGTPGMAELVPLDIAKPRGGGAKVR
jgi:hypothetical protein